VKDVGGLTCPLVRGVSMVTAPVAPRAQAQLVTTTPTPEPTAAGPSQVRAVVRALRPANVAAVDPGASQAVAPAALAAITDDECVVAELAALRHELRLAEALLVSGRPAAAAAVLQAAATSAAGVQPVGWPRTAGHSTAYGLTSRERAVLVLLTRGRTNAQIGTALFISPKTVSAHVTNILRKLGVTCRVQAATWAERAGLAEGMTP
jgi:DNA-binding CsgD family transcriptional regulator